MQSASDSRSTGERLLGVPSIAQSSYAEVHRAFTRTSGRQFSVPVVFLRPTGPAALVTRPGPLFLSRSTPERRVPLERPVDICPLRRVEVRPPAIDVSQHLDDLSKGRSHSAAARAPESVLPRASPEVGVPDHAQVRPTYAFQVSRLHWEPTVYACLEKRAWLSGGSSLRKRRSDPPVARRGGTTRPLSSRSTAEMQ